MHHPSWQAGPCIQVTGRDFETKEFREDIIADLYEKMDEGILNFLSTHITSSNLSQLTRERDLYHISY